MTKFALTIPRRVLKLTPKYSPEELGEHELLTRWLRESQQEKREHLAKIVGCNLRGLVLHAWWEAHGSEFKLVSPDDLRLWEKYLPGWLPDVGPIEFENMRADLENIFPHIGILLNKRTGEGAAFGMIPAGGSNVLVARWCPDGRDLPTVVQIRRIVETRMRAFRRFRRWQLRRSEPQIAWAV